MNPYKVTETKVTVNGHEIKLISCAGQINAAHEYLEDLAIVAAALESEGLTVETVPCKASDGSIIFYNLTAK